MPSEHGEQKERATSSKREASGRYHAASAARRRPRACSLVSLCAQRTPPSARMVLENRYLLTLKLLSLAELSASSAARRGGTNCCARKKWPFIDAAILLETQFMGQMFRKWGWQKDAIFWIGCHLKPFITILQKKLRVTMMQKFFVEKRHTIWKVSLVG